MYENLFNLINDLQKFAIKIKVQEALNTICKDERIHEVLDADVVLKYYEKMYEHFEKNPKDFLFPNREWLRDSLKRVKADLSNIFDEDANVDHIKREEIIVLFMLLWIHMKIQDPDSSSDVKTPYDLFIMWIYDRVFISRPTDTRYLQDGDWKVLDRIYDKYGWFTKGHCFTIGAKGAVEYHHSSPDDITNIDGAYNKAHGSVTKLRSHNIARNTKFVVREMTGISNKDYKAFLKKFKEKEVMRYDETSQCFEDILKISSLEFDHEVILEAVDVYNRNVYHLNKALLKLKEKLNERN